MGQRDILVLIAKLLIKHKIPYLLTGSIAVSFYGYPRATHDIDFIIEIPAEKTTLLISALDQLDGSFLIDKNQIKQVLHKSGQFDIYHPESGIKVDFWISRSLFDQNKFTRTKKIIVNKQKVNLISTEDLILAKLLWCKKIRSDRHLRDCTGIWQIQKNKIDINYVNLWAEKLEVKDLLNEIKEMKY